VPAFSASGKSYRAAEARLVVVVDQLDELFTQESLSAVTDRRNRDWTDHPPAGARGGAALRDRRGPRGNLDEVILSAAGGSSGALPLLSFLFDQLWRRGTPEAKPTCAAYDDLGGLEGVIGRRAGEVFREQPDTVRNESTGLLRASVTVAGDTAFGAAGAVSRGRATAPAQPTWASSHRSSDAPVSASG